MNIRRLSSTRDKDSQTISNECLKTIKISISEAKETPNIFQSYTFIKLEEFIKAKFFRYYNPDIKLGKSNIREPARRSSYDIYKLYGEMLLLDDLKRYGISYIKVKCNKSHTNCPLSFIRKNAFDSYKGAETYSKLSMFIKFSYKNMYNTLKDSKTKVKSEGHQCHDHYIDTIRRNQIISSMIYR